MKSHRMRPLTEEQACVVLEVLFMRRTAIRRKP